MNLRNIFILVFALLNGINISPVVISCSLYEKSAGAHTNKRILVIGNYHADNAEDNSPMVTDDKFDSLVVFDWLKNSKNKIHFLHEFTDFVVIRKKALCNQLYSWFLNNKNKNLSYKFADVRTRNLETLLDIYWDYQNNISQYDANELKSAIKSVCDLTIEALIEEIEQIKISLINRTKNLPATYTKYLSPGFRALDQDFDATKKFLSQYDQSTSIIDLSIDALVQKSEKVSNFINNIYLNLEMCIADIGFALSILEAQTDHDNIVLFTGNDHAININRYLEVCGYKKIFAHGILNDFTFMYSKRVIEIDQLQKLLTSAFDREQLCEARICAGCQKKQGDKRCTHCKQVFYCSLDCQKADWAVHQLNCPLDKENK